MGLQQLVVVAVVDQGVDGVPRVLLGEKTRGMGEGKLVMPGGHIEDGETPRIAAARELDEETGLVTDPARLRFGALVTSFFPARPSWDCDIYVYRADRFTGELRDSDELLTRWFPIDDLPWEWMWPDGRLWMDPVLTGEPARVVVQYDRAGEALDDASCQPF